MQGDTRGAQLLRRAMHLLEKIECPPSGCYAPLPPELEAEAQYLPRPGHQATCLRPRTERLIGEIANHVAEVERQPVLWR